jgi:hypothetical protein
MNYIKSPAIAHVKFSDCSILNIYLTFWDLEINFFHQYSCFIVSMGYNLNIHSLGISGGCDGKDKDCP